MRHSSTAYGVDNELQYLFAFLESDVEGAG